MNLNWFQSIIYGLVSSLTDILPVSSQAHRVLLMRLFGEQSEPGILRLLVDIGILVALYFCCQNHIIRIMRARRLARIPKRKRKRPLDTMSLMDFGLFRIMLIPVILSFLLYNRLAPLGESMLLLAVFMLLNGMVLYVPQFFPSANRNSKTVSRLHGLFVGFGGALNAVPGFSGVGASLSVSSLCGVDRTYALNMTLLLNIGIRFGIVVLDIISLAVNGMNDISFVGLLSCICAAVIAFASTFLGIKIMRMIAKNAGFSGFAYYCWGIALFTFIMNLLA